MIPPYPNDRDYFFDVDENIYQVIGYIHPTNAIYCLKKYTKIQEEKFDSDQFIWKSRLTGQSYIRNMPMYSSKTALLNIKKNEYRKLSTLYGVDFIHFPKSEIKKYLNPRVKLKKLRDQVQTLFPSLTDQERSAIEISYIFERELGIDSNNLGITGSILWEGVHPNSDIDFVIYGIKNMIRFFKGIKKLIQSIDKFRLPSLVDQINWAGKFSQKSGLSENDCTVFIANKKFLMYFSKYYFSIAFDPTEPEIQQNTLALENTQFQSIADFSSVTIQATVKNDEWMYFYPGVIYIEEVNFISPEMEKTPPICRIVVFEHENIGYYEKGSKIEIKGLVQSILKPPQDVITSTYVTYGKTERYAQIIVGTAENYGNEYIKNLSI